MPPAKPVSGWSYSVVYTALYVPTMGRGGVGWHCDATHKWETRSGHGDPKRDPTLEQSA